MLYSDNKANSLGLSLEKKMGEKNGKKKKRLMKIVATTSFASSLPPERRPLEHCTLVPIVRNTNHSTQNVCLIGYSFVYVLYTIHIGVVIEIIGKVCCTLTQQFCRKVIVIMVWQKLPC